MGTTPNPAAPLPERLTSLDFFRGFTMFMLVGEATNLYSVLNSPAFDGTLIGAIELQLEQQPWNDLRFWDLIQPFFMFIVGVVMPFSIGKLWERGEHWRLTL